MLATQVTDALQTGFVLDLLQHANPLHLLNCISRELGESLGTLSTASTIY